MSARGRDGSGARVACVESSLQVIEVIDLILDFTVPPHQVRRLWRHQGLRITAQLGEDSETPGACMAHYPTACPVYTSRRVSCRGCQRHGTARQAEMGRCKVKASVLGSSSQSWESTFVCAGGHGCRGVAGTPRESCPTFTYSRAEPAGRHMRARAQICPCTRGSIVVFVTRKSSKVEFTGSPRQCLKVDYPHRLCNLIECVPIARAYEAVDVELLGNDGKLVRRRRVPAFQPCAVVANCVGECCVRKALV